MEESYSVYLCPLFDKDVNVMRDHFSQHGFTDFQKFTCYPSFGFVDFKTYEQAKNFIAVYNGMTINGLKISASFSKSRKPSDKPPRPSRDETYSPPRREYRDSGRDSGYDNRDYRRDSEESRYNDRRDWDSSYDRRSPDYGRDSYDRRGDHRDKYYSNRETKTVTVRGNPLTLSERDLFNEFSKIDCFIRQVEIRGPVAYIAFDSYGDSRAAVNKMDNVTIKGCHIRVDYTDDIPLNLPKMGIPLIALEEKRY
ncbi:hypothetical protein TVAG_243270 [Trichomonas vaginalis G3]|uniref:RRM domain-containing protein n=1 Tax=Trichomonas vaginalis (strain ATCC PRA-98 / G3) TaxID=412133 RepID=A2FI11_TRIV3|nr:RNA-binding domain, RBD family-containing protein [Trichomonas vaginalis G3]EAX95439.1 hypothetical protein TVAG_243270 [Trichomonas vaginalis G3]KAI5542884.1 RNA-binding domain, RBD family-containing protein [Trichomonas vaginalis G3]|eukprot:XP_001308369.1 hypothetical protein [Trichomonas vaginalis G3]